MDSPHPQTALGMEEDRETQGKAMATEQRLTGFLKTISDNKLLSTLIGAAVVSLCGYLSLTWAKTFTWIKSSWSAVWSCLVYPVGIPVWLLLLLGLLALWILLRASSKGVRKVLQPTWYDYREDVFLGVVWRWEYHREAIQEKTIRGFCPNDDTELVLNLGVGNASIRCETCHRSWPTSVPCGWYSHAQLQAVVARQIERRIRSGEWQSVIEKRKSGS